MKNSLEILRRYFHLSRREAAEVSAAIRPVEQPPLRDVATAPTATSKSPRCDTDVAFHVVENHPTWGPSRLPPPTAPTQAVLLTEDLRRLHMTVSKQLLDNLDAARKGQGHALPGASAEKVIEAALDLLLAQQAKRRAEVKKPQQNPRPAKNASHIPAAVRREVWSRDEGKCTWPLDSGGVCGSTLRLEIDHVIPRGRGGASTVKNCRLACAMHNQLAARQVYGDDWMDQFTSGAGRNMPVARGAAAPAWAADRRMVCGGRHDTFG